MTDETNTPNVPGTEEMNPVESPVAPEQEEEGEGETIPTPEETPVTDVPTSA